MDYEFVCEIFEKFLENFMCFYNYVLMVFVLNLIFYVIIVVSLFLFVVLFKK